ncbi:MAG: hypothetical protein ACF8NJ_04175 [Phycisphaerales bacterium JB038]
MRLNVCAFALALGILWGLAVFAITWWVIIWQGISDPPEITLLGRVYKGYSVSYLGSAIGLAWGLGSAFVAGGVFAWLYNLLSCSAGKTPSADAA